MTSLYAGLYIVLSVIDQQGRTRQVETVTLWNLGFALDWRGAPSAWRIAPDPAGIISFPLVPDEVVVMVIRTDLRGPHVERKLMKAESSWLIVLGHSCPLGGTVVDPVGDGVESARVELWWPDVDEPVLHTVTGAKGDFEFEAVEEGEYEMKVIASGFVLEERPIVLEGCNARVTVSLERGPGVNIRVRNDLGEPVSDARVLIQCREEKRASLLGRTNTEGQISFPSTLPCDTAGITAFHPKHEPAYKAEARLRRTGSVSGADVVDVQLKRGASVSGCVVDPAGNGIEGAVVTIEGRAVHSGAKGEFQIDALPFGVLTLRAMAPGWATSQQYMAVDEAVGDLHDVVAVLLKED